MYEYMYRRMVRENRRRVPLLTSAPTLSVRTRLMCVYRSYEFSRKKNTSLWIRSDVYANIHTHAAVRKQETRLSARHSAAMRRLEKTGRQIKRRRRLAITSAVGDDGLVSKCCTFEGFHVYGSRGCSMGLHKSAFAERICRSHPRFREKIPNRLFFNRLP